MKVKFSQSLIGDLNLNNYKKHRVETREYIAKDNGTINFSTSSGDISYKSMLTKEHIEAAETKIENSLLQHANNFSKETQLKAEKLLAYRRKNKARVFSSNMSLVECQYYRETLKKLRDDFLNSLENDKKKMILDTNLAA